LSAPSTPAEIAWLESRRVSGRKVCAGGAFLPTDLRLRGEKKGEQPATKVARRLLRRRGMTPRLPRTLEDIMTRDVVTIGENDDLLHLLETLRALRHRHMPVIDDGRLVGLLTERDVLGFSASNLLPHRHEADRMLQQRFHVRDVMQRDVASAPPGMTIREAGRLMLQKRIGCLPVVDDSNVLLGIVTSSDLIRAAVELAPNP
jgi:CBS domain-containing protein